ncbi:MAG: DUF6444 domain-containing protein, partial [Candidatus Hydrogenedentota bacterium]
MLRLVEYFRQWVVLFALNAEDRELRIQIAGLSETEEIERMVDLTARVAELEQSVGMSSANSCKPPSSAGWRSRPRKAVARRAGTNAAARPSRTTDPSPFPMAFWCMIGGRLFQ